MADQEGPGKHKLIDCAPVHTGWSLSSLGDVRGFDAPGEQQIYGLELMHRGVYKRTAIPQGSNIEEPDWDIRLELRSQYLDTKHYPESAGKAVANVVHEGSHAVTRLRNAGKMFCIYTPNTSKSLDLSGELNFYSITTKLRTAAHLEATPTFEADRKTLTTPPRGSTIFLELVLHNHPAGWIEVLPGVSIMWSKGMRAGLVITKPDDKLEFAATSPELKVRGDKVSLNIIHCGQDYEFVRILFTTSPVSKQYLKHLTDSIAIRETQLKMLKQN
jgi:hypothetical protein